MRKGILTVIVALLALMELSCKDRHPEVTGQGIMSPNSDQPQLFAAARISTGDYETHPAFSPTGDTLYFLKCLADANFCTICVSYKKDSGWTAPEVTSFSGKYTDVDPFVTSDGNSLYFASNRPVNDGDSARQDWDIWRTDRTANGWGSPVHLDSSINSNSSEYFPTISDNGNLYFGSSRAGGKGRADIYLAKWVGHRYGKPENLGDSINTADNEYEPFISPDERYLIYMTIGWVTISQKGWLIMSAT